MKTLAHVLVSLCMLGSYHFLPGGGPSVGWGDQNCLGWSKGGNQFFFSGSKGGPEFFEDQRGGTKIFSQFFVAPSAQFIPKFITNKYFAPPAQPFSLPYFMPHNRFICNQFFFFYPWVIYSYHCPLHCLRRGSSFTLGLEGGPEFFRIPKGGTKIFSRRQRRGPFFYICKGETTKNW